MWSEDLESLYQEYLPQYRSEVESFQPGQLRNLIQKAAKAARSNYKKLIKPKTCSLDTYIAYWTREMTLSDFVRRTLRKTNTQHPGPHQFEQAFANYYRHFPFDLLPRLTKEIFDAEPQKRKSVWKDLALPIEEIDE